MRSDHLSKHVKTHTNKQQNNNATTAVTATKTTTTTNQPTVPITPLHSSTPSIQIKRELQSSLLN